MFYCRLVGWSGHTNKCSQWWIIYLFSKYFPSRWEQMKEKHEIFYTNIYNENRVSARAQWNERMNLMIDVDDGTEWDRMIIYGRGRLNSGCVGCGGGLPFLYNIQHIYTLLNRHICLAFWICCLVYFFLAVWCEYDCGTRCAVCSVQNPFSV